MLLSLSCKLAMQPIILRVSPCVTVVVVFDLHEQLASINRTATRITHGMKYARLEVSSDEDQSKFVCLRRGICNPQRCDNVWIRT